VLAKMSAKGAIVNRSIKELLARLFDRELYYYAFVHLCIKLCIYTHLCGTSASRKNLTLI